MTMAPPCSRHGRAALGIIKRARTERILFVSMRKGFQCWAITSSVSQVDSISYQVTINIAYPPEQNNKYLDQPLSSRSLLDDAKALLDQNGSLSEAAMMLEAAIQEGQLGVGGFETWILLGETRNMDEREDAGMRALTHGVKLAEEAGAPGAGMLVCVC